MVPRYATGIWWTRWFNFNNYDVLKVLILVVVFFVTIISRVVDCE